MLATARAANAAALVLAGDTFERHATPRALAVRAAQLIAAADLPVIILPGNHDPALPNSPHHTVAALAPRAVILGVTHQDEVRLGDLTVTGVAHAAYADGPVVARLGPKATRWRIVLAHGHFEAVPDPSRRFRPSWIVAAQDLKQDGIDYVALGHWNRPVRVLDTPPAYYSGSPEYAGTVNRVTFFPSRPPEIERLPIVGWPTPSP